MATSNPVARARSLFLTNETTYGCAESTLIALQEHFRLPNASDSSPAMALNGGVAYTGGMCGAITGAALAVGRLAGRRIRDHREAKRITRLIIGDLIAAFEAEMGALDCRSLTGYDMLRDHDAFIADGTWRVSCTRQILFVVDHLELLASPGGWDAEMQRLGVGSAESAEVASPGESQS